MGIFHAWRYVSRVELIDLDALAAAGIRCLLLDRDNTIVPRDTKRAPHEVAAWIARAHELGFSLCFVSNNIHTRLVAADAAEFDAGYIDRAMKPLPLAVKRALDKMGVSADEAVLIGDQVFTDICAGNLGGVRTILVRPQSRRDLWYTYLFRVFESLTLLGRRFEGE
ncbi:YqeG family HAD IIIA-type phosphatase [Coriobacteriales bacterium OH1046]|nr:YqeG family HAD IIIA-type phosphatase [Coriobacteriales bacterium OH1046]